MRRVSSDCTLLKCAASVNLLTSDVGICIVIKGIVQRTRHALEVDNRQILSIFWSWFLYRRNMDTHHNETSRFAHVECVSRCIRGDEITITEVEGEEVAIVKKANNLEPYLLAWLPQNDCLTR